MLNWIEIAEEIEDLFVGDAKVVLAASIISKFGKGRFDSEHVGEVQAFSPCSSETKL